jgi:hypothetical protein
MDKWLLVTFPFRSGPSGKPAIDTSNSFAIVALLLGCRDKHDAGLVAI